MPRIPPRTGEIKKGQVRNPKGSSAKARMLGQIRRLTAEQLAEVTSLLLTGNREQMGKVAADAAASFLQVWTAKLMVDSYKKGDVAIYKAILDRVVGSPRQTVDVGGQAGGEPVRIETMTTEEKLERLRQLRAAREATQ